MNTKNSILNALKDSGWDSARKQNWDRERESLVSDGYSLNSYANAILDNFAFLIIRKCQKVGNCPNSDIIFDPIFSCGLRSKAEVWEDIIGNGFFPVAVIFNAMSLLVSDTGKIYSGHENEVWYVGSDIWDTFDVVLCGSRHLEQII